MSATFTARGLALLAVVCLACNEPGQEAAPQVSTQRKQLEEKPLASMGSQCESARQPRLIVAPAAGSEEAPAPSLQFEGKELDCGETYELVVSAPDGTSTSESLTADSLGKVRSTAVIEGPPEDYQAKLYDSTGEEVAQTLSHTSAFRYGHLTWRSVGPRTAEFSLVNVFRRTYPGSGPDGLAVTGDRFQENFGYANLCFGDGVCSGTLTYEVTSHDVQRGWLTAKALTPQIPQRLPGTGVTVTESEPNDSISTANTMQPGDDYFGTVSTAYERDYVRFTLTEQTQVEVRTVMGTMRDSYLYLYDATGRLLASDDDSGGGLSSFISRTLQAGTYYIAAAGYSSSTGSQTVQLRKMGLPPVGPITHTYSSNGPFTATVSSCCRIDGLSNSSGSYRLESRVGFTVTNSTPVSSLAPLLEVPTRTPDFSFQIPATDADGDQLTFRLAHYYESYVWNLPPGLTVSSSGRVSWNTMRALSGTMWAIQVIIEERRNGVLIGTTPVDFLALITGDSGAPPSCVPPPQAHYTLRVNQTLNFTVGTQDPDAWDSVTLSASSLPWGTTMEPALPLEGPSGINSTFSFTPSVWDADLWFQAYFTVTDSTGQTGQCSVTIEVLGLSNYPPVADAGWDQYVSEGATVTLDGTGSSDRENEPLSYHWSLLEHWGPAVTLSDASSATPSFTALNDGGYTFLLTVTDNEGLTDSATVFVSVYNAAPEVSVTSGQPVDEGQEFTTTGFISDPGVGDTFTALVDYGDGAGFEPLEVIHGAFTLRHRYLDDRNYYGNYWVTLFVTDDSGAQGSTYLLPEVRNVAPVMTPPTRLTGAQGQTLTVSIPFTDPGADSWWAWVDYGDGSSDYVWSPGGELTFQHAYYAPGTYSITVTLWDDESGQHTVTIPAEIQNQAPIVHLATPAGPFDEGSWAYTHGTFEDSGYWWEDYTLTVDYGDGTGVQPLYYDSYSRSFWLSHPYADNGTYVVTVTVTDSFGATGTATATVVVNNVAPWVYMEDSWYGSNEGSLAPLRGYFYDPGTQDTWTATVDYGDGTGVHTMELTSNYFAMDHVYANNGIFTVTLTVSDDDGGTASATRQVYVYNVTPTVSVTSGALDEGSTFRSSGSFTDPGADTWTARVNYGDGTGWQPLALNGKSFALEHVYANSGYYTVYVGVQDSDGAEGNAYAYASVRNVVPVVVVSGGSTNEGSAFTFSGTITDPGNERYWWATIDYGDGSYQEVINLYSRSFTLNHVYGENGTYTATIRIRDDGGTGTTTAQVVVHNVAPTVSSAGGSGNEGALISWSASYTDPGTRDTVVARVDYGDGSPVETIIPRSWERSFTMVHRYADNGTYLVTISVTDDDGGVGTATAPVVVRNVAPVMTAVVSCSPDEGAPCDTTGQFSDPGADSWTVSVNFGDGSAPQVVSVAAGASKAYAASHVYDDNGFYTMAVTLTDDDGDSSTFTRLVWVRNVAPTVTASNDSPRYWGVPVSLTGTATDPSQADTEAGFTASWALGDGATASELVTAHAYAGPGTYWALLTVTDKDGGSNTVPGMTAVTIQKRPASLSCQDTTVVYGFPAALSARFADGVLGGLPGGRSLSFRLGDATALGSATTDATGLASVRSPGELLPGSYPLTVSFAEDSHYTAAEASCTLTVTRSNGLITGGGLRFPNSSRGGFNVMLAEGGPVQGELQFQNATTSFHAQVMTALGLSADKRQGWFAGVGRDGRAFTAYLEDNGEPGGTDVFKLWIDGTLQTGDGAISGGNIQIH